MKTITPPHLHSRLQSGEKLRLLDVRTPAQDAEIHVPGAHPAFIWLSGFIGAGLIFAGLTDWCGMGLFIGRMPWNQRVGSPRSAG